MRSLRNKIGYTAPVFHKRVVTKIRYPETVFAFHIIFP